MSHRLIRGAAFRRAPARVVGQAEANSRAEPLAPGLLPVNVEASDPLDIGEAFVGVFQNFG